MPGAGKGAQIARHLAIGALVLGSTLVFVIFSGPRREAGDRHREQAKPVVRIPRTPVLHRPGPIWRRTAPGADRVLPRAGEPKAPGEEAGLEELAAAEERRELEKEARRAWEEESRRLGQAEEELRKLREYARLVPSADLNAFHFLLGKFGDVSRTRRSNADPEEHEGLFFNRTFFAAGGWGRLPELRRSWVYLFRAIGCELQEKTEASVVELLADLFERGSQETRAIETAVFGAPLEGGDPRDWEAGTPSLEKCGEAWKIRNQACLALYDEFIMRLGWVLPLPAYERAMEFFELFNLRTRR